jgi:predicted nucleic acid-binding protein
VKVLVDTSIWSLTLRRNAQNESPHTNELRILIAGRRVEMVGPIRQELLSGVKEETQFKRLETHLAAFPDVPLTTEDYIAAARFFNLCRAKGVQGSNTDFLICAIASRLRWEIYTADKDFTQYAKHLPITLH